MRARAAAAAGAMDWQSILPVVIDLGSPLAIPPVLEGLLCDPARCKGEPCLSLQTRRKRDEPEWPQEAARAAAG